MFRRPKSAPKKTRVGNFGCQTCSRRWRSARAQPGVYQKCIECFSTCYPVEFHWEEPNKLGNMNRETFVGHTTELCGKCIELGYSCQELSELGQVEQEEELVHDETISTLVEMALQVKPKLSQKQRRKLQRAEMSGVHVLPDGTPRQGGMDEDECDQCIHDIADWFVRKADLNAKGAKSADIKTLEQELDRELPSTLKSMLIKQNGDLWFDEYKSLSSTGIVRTAETLSGVSGWKSSFIPFATDVDGNALIIDVASKNAVCTFTEDGKGASLAATLSIYLEEYRNRLLSGRFEFIEDVGLVERSRK